MILALFNFKAKISMVLNSDFFNIVIKRSHIVWNGNPMSCRHAALEV